MIQTTVYGPVIRFDLARTLLGRGRYWTTAYWVGGLLVDSGCAFSAPELERRLHDLPLETLVNTHSHEDHIGANGLLQRRRGPLNIFAHPRAVPVLYDPRRRQPLHPYRRVLWGWPAPSQAEPLCDGDRIEAGPYVFQVVFTPGHSADHLCLYEPEQGWIFSGDTFVGGEDRALGAGSDIWGIIAALKKLETLPARRLFPGSARVRLDPQQEIRAKISYLEALGDQVLALDRQGRSVPEIARALLGKPLLVESLTLGHFSRRRLVKSYLRRV